MTKNSTDKYRATLEDMAKGKTVDLRIDLIRADDETQSRIAGLGNTKETQETAKQSRLVVDDIASTAKVDKKWELPNPIMVAIVDDEYVLIDGHHRLEGFKQAQRETIRAYTLAMSDDDRKRLAIQANSQSQTVRETGNERREKAWQLTLVGHEGSKWISKNDNNIRVAKRYDVDVRTIRQMIKAKEELISKNVNVNELSWVEAKCELEDVKEYSEWERDDTRSMVKLAKKLVSSSKVRTLEHKDILIGALDYLLDNNTPYGLTLDETIKAIKAKRDGTPKPNFSEALIKPSHKMSDGSDF